MKTSKWMVAGFLVLIILIIVAVAQILGKFSYQDIIYSNFWVFMFSLLTIVILSIIGSAFIGMYISQKYLSDRNFTPFEEEMLKMRKEVGEIREKIQKLEEKGK